MRTTRQFSITLPHEMAKMIRAKISSGEYATESEVVRDGLRALQARDRAVERWLHDVVVPTADAMKADRSRGRSAAKVRRTLAAVHKAEKKR
jgi:antitoxin ParD1/3/4